MDILEKMPLMISHLEKVLEMLQPMQQSMVNASGQTRNPMMVDDYYNLMLAFERTKEARERLLAVFQKLKGD